MQNAVRLLLSAAALVALQGQSPVGGGAPPIRLTSCVFGVGTALPTGYTARIGVGFGVVGAVGVKDIRFTIHWNDGTTAPAYDVGNYTPGHSIRHDVYVPLTYHLTTEAIVAVGLSVDAADLADGTTWVGDGGSVTRCAVYPVGR
jgi:hypothetical protein